MSPSRVQLAISVRSSQATRVGVEVTRGAPPMGDVALASGVASTASTVCAAAVESAFWSAPVAPGRLQLESTRQVLRKIKIRDLRFMVFSPCSLSDTPYYKLLLNQSSPISCSWKWG